MFLVEELFSRVVVVVRALITANTDTTANAYVPVAPCRLFDFRSGADNVGPKNTPLGSSYVLQAFVRNTKVGNLTNALDLRIR